MIQISKQGNSRYTMGKGTKPKVILWKKWIYWQTLSKIDQEKKERTQLASIMILTGHMTADYLDIKRIKMGKTKYILKI